MGPLSEIQNQAGSWMCSQLVQLGVKSGDAKPGILEEITATTAAISVDDPIEPGAVVSLMELPAAISAEVVDFIVRETDFVVRLKFLDDYRWSPSDWLPSHAYEITQAAKSAAAGHGDTGG